MDSKTVTACSERRFKTPLIFSSGLLLVADMPLNAEGTIVYYNQFTSVNSVFGPALLTGVGIQFMYAQTYSATASGGYYNFKAQVNLESVFVDGGAGYAKNFAAGEVIGGATGLSAWNQTQTLFSFTGKGGAYNSNFKFNGDAKTGYIGFRDHDSGNYGWAYIEVTDGYSYKINGWAYEDSGGTIKAGETPSGGAAPEPSGLALLACGAAGIFALRRKMKK
jgi:hypothetical protein